MRAAARAVFHVKQSDPETVGIDENRGFSDGDVEFLARNLPEVLHPRLSEALPLLEAHLSELEIWAPRLNLVAAGTRKEWLRRHFLDSLRTAGPLIEESGGSIESLMDVGSGAGFPGIPLAALLRPERTLLVEPRQRRAHFLRAVARRCPAPIIEVRNERLEDLTITLPQAVVVSRATFSDLGELLAGCLSRIGQGSLVMALCSPAAPWPESEELRSAYQTLETRAYRLPEADRQHQVRLWRRL